MKQLLAFRQNFAQFVLGLDSPPLLQPNKAHDVMQRQLLMGAVCVVSGCLCLTLAVLRLKHLI